MTLLRQALCIAVLTAVVLVIDAAAQTFFYNEVAKDGRIYVFADAARHSAFVESDGTQTGPVIERPGYGPNGETVVFDSQDAVNLYNFKHGLPGESFAKPEESKKSEYSVWQVQWTDVWGLLLVLRQASGRNQHQRFDSGRRTARSVVPAESISRTTSPTTRNHHALPARSEQQR